MTNDETVLEAARSIRPYLNQLAGSEATAIDQQLADLLKEAAGGSEGVDVHLLEVLGNPRTQAWTAEFFANALPREVVALQERSFRLPGDPEPNAAPRYVCPVGADYTWYRLNVGVAVPVCPTHDVPLVQF